MNWDKAKNFTMLFLALLNVLMGAQIAAGRREYRLDAAQLRNIREALAGAGIGLNAPVPADYSPMRQLALARCDYDEDALVDLFFSRPDEALRSGEPDKTVFRGEGAELSIQNDGYVTLDNPYGVGGTGSFDEGSAKAICDGFVGVMNKSMPGLAFDSCLFDEDAGGYRVFYRQAYKNTVIYTNFAGFLVTRDGVTQMDCFYGKPLGLTGASMEICSPDVALLDFMEKITGYYGNQDYSVSISRISLAYYQEGGNSQDYETLKATPYYRITFFDGPDERDFFVDAYVK